MGRLVIAHHKSYHPYRADNVERVRADEEEARQQEAKEEGRLRLADSEARINLLRKRAGIMDSNRHRSSRDEEIIPEPVRASLNDYKKEKSRNPAMDPIQSLMTDGHINLFADIENQEAAVKRSVEGSKSWQGKKDDDDDDDTETDQGYRLAPSEADRKPWYIKPKEESHTQLDPEKCDRDELRKQRHDPLKEVEASLSRMTPASERSSASSLRTKHPMDPPHRPASSTPQPDNMLDSRLSREQTERQRAAELIARKRREQMVNETPTTEASSDAGFGNLYNKADVEAANRRRRGEGAQWSDRVKHWDGTQGHGRRW